MEPVSEESPIYRAAYEMSAAYGMDYTIDHFAHSYDAILPGLGDALRNVWRDIRHLVYPDVCDCPMDPYHRWNCTGTPIWAQTIRDLDTNPWTVFRPQEMEAIGGPKR